LQILENYGNIPKLVIEESITPSSKKYFGAKDHKEVKK